MRLQRWTPSLALPLVVISGVVELKEFGVIAPA
jgi:hypothetical protein